MSWNRIERFKTGEKVECVDDTSAFGEGKNQYLDKGKIYTIDREGSMNFDEDGEKFTFVSIKEVEGVFFYSTRFIRANLSQVIELEF